MGAFFMKLSYENKLQIYELKQNEVDVTKFTLPERRGDTYLLF